MALFLCNGHRAGMHTAKEYSMGLTLQFPDLPSLKSESAIRQSVGFLRTAKHVIKDGKDQMAPLIESDDISPCDNVKRL